MVVPGDSLWRDIACGGSFVRSVARCDSSWLVVAHRGSSWLVVARRGATWRAGALCRSGWLGVGGGFWRVAAQCGMLRHVVVRCGSEGGAMQFVLSRWIAR